MLAVALSATAAGLAVTGAFVMLFRKASCARDAATIDENWLNEFSIARYRPMERLLSDDDYRFLESQPAFNPRLEKKLRTERRAIFSSYLGYLAQDFERLYRATQSLAQIRGGGVDVGLVCGLALLPGHERPTLIWNTASPCTR